jgi:hypothetical protein
MLTVDHMRYIYIYILLFRLFFCFWKRGTEFKIIYSMLDSDNRVTNLKGNSDPINKRNSNILPESKYL